MILTHPNDKLRRLSRAVPGNWEGLADLVARMRKALGQAGVHAVAGDLDSAPVHLPALAQEREHRVDEALDGVHRPAVRRGAAHAGEVVVPVELAGAPIGGRIERPFGHRGQGAARWSPWVPGYLRSQVLPASQWRVFVYSGYRGSSDRGVDPIDSAVPGPNGKISASLRWMCSRQATDGTWKAPPAVRVTK